MMQPNASAANWEELWQGFRWQVPAQYNIARECCGRWADDRSRFALYDEDAAGATSAWTFRDIQTSANRLSNVLAAMGVMRGDRVALLLPPSAQAAIALIACFQMGAIALPLGTALAAPTLEARLADSASRVAIVDGDGIAALAAVHARLPALMQVIGVGAAQESWLRAWTDLLPLASARYTPLATAADDAALLVYGNQLNHDGAGVLLAQRSLLGNLPGFVCAHEFYPRRGDLVWSALDWTHPDGLFGGLLAPWNFGQPVLAYRGSFDAEKACWLLAKYGVRNCTLSSTQWPMMMALSALRARHDIEVRSLVSVGASAPADVLDWVHHEFGIYANGIFGTMEFNALLGGCHSVFASRPGALGRPFPGHQLALLDAAGRPVAAGATGELCVAASCQGSADPAPFLGYWQDAAATRQVFFRGGDAWGRTGELARQDDDGYYWHQGSRRKE